MKREDIEGMADRLIENSPELVDAFHEAAIEEQQETKAPDGRSQVQLRRDPVWLEPYKFKPGQCGNPAGRPPTVKKISQGLINRLKEIEPESGKSYAELIAIALIRKALNGDVFAAREIRETTEGLLSQRLEITGQVQLQQQIAKASNDELEQIIATYVARKQELPS